MIIDLSVSITEKTPVYPGDPPVKIETAGVLERDGYCDHVVTIGTHVGTHIDAPMHMLAGGKALADYPLERFVGRGVCIDVRSGFDSLYTATIQKDDILLLYHGYGEKYHRREYFQEYSALPPKAADLLIEKHVSMVGSDTCSPDNGADFPIHRQLLAADVLIIENLTNLGRLVGKSFNVFALPLALIQDAAPARVIAQLTE
ncbi:cyclase family protein [Candidatus Saccharibacteria bacterium]|nr:cyclase family protein [Candidatus Saccharibacteria bacterium]